VKIQKTVLAFCLLGSVALGEEFKRGQRVVPDVMIPNSNLEVAQESFKGSGLLQGFYVLDVKEGKAHVFGDTTGDAGWVETHKLMSFERAVARLNEWISSNTNDWRPVLRRAFVYNEMGRYDDSINDAILGLVLINKDTFFDRETLQAAKLAAINSKGVSFQGKKQHLGAVEAFTEAIVLSPKKIQMYLNRASSYTALGMFDKAIEDCSRAIALDDNIALSYAYRAQARLGKQDYKEVIRDSDRALELSPNHLQSLYARGVSYRALKRFKNAKEDLQKAVALSPKFKEALSVLAWTLSTAPEASVRDGQEAVKLALRLVDLTAARDGLAFGNLAAAYAESGDFEKAIEMQRLANGLYPKEQPELLVAGNERIKLYEAKRPYHEDDVPLTPEPAVKSPVKDRGLPTPIRP
jgi:tetratricopeptide (TPR) repeat protein